MTTLCLVFRIRREGRSESETARREDPNSMWAWNIKCSAVLGGSEDISSLNNIKDKSKFKRGKLKIMIIVVCVQWGTLDYFFSPRSFHWKYKMDCPRRQRFQRLNLSDIFTSPCARWPIKGATRSPDKKVISPWSSVQTIKMIWLVRQCWFPKCFIILIRT